MISYSGPLVLPRTPPEEGLCGVTIMVSMLVSSVYRLAYMKLILTPATKRELTSALTFRLTILLLLTVVETAVWDLLLIWLETSVQTGIRITPSLARVSIQ